ncbi:DinB family protein [Angustibacter peucedani]
MPIAPDTKDWTWVLERPCPECRFDAPAISRDDVPDLLRRNASAWIEVLRRPDVDERPDPSTWSPLEYACHVRDVHEVFGGRYEQLLGEDDPQFANWDQDEAAARGDYPGQAPPDVAAAIVAGAEAVAARLTGLDDATWARPGRRSNGSVFTVDSLARYHPARRRAPPLGRARLSQAW